MTINDELPPEKGKVGSLLNAQMVSYNGGEKLGAHFYQAKRYCSFVKNNQDINFSI
jgi:hypothetical protein